MQWHDFLLSGAAFFSEVLGTVSGFGSSTFFVPAAVLFEKIHLVLALTAILHCFGNAFKIYIFRKNFEPKLFFKIALPSVLLTAVGALLNEKISTLLFQKFLGIFLILLPIIMIFGKQWTTALPLKISVALSALSGFLTGLLGTGGALRGLVLSSMSLEKNAFVLFSSGIDIGGDLLRAGIYLNNGYMDWNQWFYLPLLLVAAYLGTKIGKQVLQKIDQNLFEKIVAIFIALSGFAMLLQAK